MSNYTVFSIPDSPSHIYYINNKLTQITNALKKYCYNRDDCFLEVEPYDETQILFIMSHKYLQKNDIIRFYKIDSLDDRSLSLLTKQTRKFLN